MWRTALHHRNLFASSLCSLLQVSEAVSAYNVEPSTNQAMALSEQSEAIGVKQGSRRSQKLLGELRPQASNLYALASAVINSARNLVVGFREETLMGAVHRASTSGTNDAHVIKTVVDETAHLVKEIRHGRTYRGIVERVRGASDVEGTKRGVGRGSGGQWETQSTAPLIVGTFLYSLSLLYRALPDYHNRVWKSLRKCSTPTGTLGDALEDLVYLAAFAWERDDCSNSEFGIRDAVDVDLGEQRGGNSHRTNLAQDSYIRVAPWDPVIQVLSWGVIPILTAENSFLSCIQAATNPETGVEGLGRREGTNSWKRAGVLAVVTAVAKGYHSLGVGQDLSAVSLGDLWGEAARVTSAAKLNCYHPMDLCRLIGRLTIA